MLAHFNEFSAEYAQKMTEKEKRDVFIIMHRREGGSHGNI